MTTPEESASPSAQEETPPEVGPNEEAGRVSLNKTAREKALRATDRKITESVAQAVSQAYVVVSDNIKQGREAAQKFSQGTYNISAVPNDVNALATRMLGLARVLTTTTLDAAERLLKEMRTPGVDSSMMAVRLRVEGVGKDKIKEHPTHLTRPSEPTDHAKLRAEPLTTPSGGHSIEDVTFSACASVEGTVATIVIPEDQPPGVYSGRVYAPGADAPLGLLTIEVVK
jgi:hypothetical protein